MKRLFPLLCTAMMLTACEKNIQAPEMLTEEINSKKTDPTIALSAGATTSATIQPVGYNPVAYSVRAVVQLNDWDKLAKDAAKADFTQLRFELQTQLIRPQGEEVSMPENDMLTLQLEKIDINTGLLYFIAKEAKFSLRYPEDQYEVKNAKLIIQYPSVNGKNAKDGDLRKVFQSSIKKAPTSSYGVEEVTIVHEEIKRVTSGNPYRVDVFNPANQTTTSFIMYAKDASFIEAAIAKSNQAGKAKFTIQPAKETKGFERLSGYFNISSGALISIGSSKWTVFTYDGPWYNPDTDGGILAQDGRGTRSSTSTAQTKPTLL